MLSVDGNSTNLRLPLIKRWPFNMNFIKKSYLSLAASPQPCSQVFFVAVAAASSCGRMPLGALQSLTPSWLVNLAGSPEKKISMKLWRNCQTWVQVLFANIRVRSFIWVRAVFCKTRECGLYSLIAPKFPFFERNLVPDWKLEQNFTDSR